MIELASIQLSVLHSGAAVIVFPRDVLRVESLERGSLLRLRDGTTISVGETVTAVQTAINALWDEYIVALGDPV
ncbi:MAG: hypothetical protein H0T51_15140 [Pirellulales bacterium]|nr:hypothetical protein [Pirellulales bacterium]